MVFSKTLWQLYFVSSIVKCVLCEGMDVELGLHAQHTETRRYVHGNSVLPVRVSETGWFMGDEEPLLKRTNRTLLSLLLHNPELIPGLVNARHVDNLKSPNINRDNKTKELSSRSSTRHYFNYLRDKRSKLVNKIEHKMKPQLMFENLEDRYQNGKKIQKRGVVSNLASRETMQEFITISNLGKIAQPPAEVLEDLGAPVGFGKYDLNTAYDASPCTVVECSLGMMVNCTYLNLDHIEPHWFPENASVLLLDNNALTTITGGVFKNLSKLVILSATSNKLEKLEEGSFVGLGHLEVLNLESNELEMTLHVYPPLVFAPLVTLKELRLLQKLSVGYHSYPEEFFKFLKNLQVLSINTVGQTLYFNSEFKSLTNLTQLEITGDVHFMDNSSFESVVHLKTLKMDTFLSVQKVTSGVFEPLKHLDILDLSYLQVGLKETLELLAPFEGRNMTVISLDAVNRYSHESYTSILSGDGVLDAEKMKHLVKICVSDVRLSRNKIFVVEEGAFQDRYVWNKCLKKLDIIDNPIVGTTTAMLSLLQFQSLASFTITGPLRNCSDVHEMLSGYAAFNGVVTSRQTLMSVSSKTKMTSLDSLYATRRVIRTKYQKESLQQKDRRASASSFKVEHTVKDKNNKFIHVSNSLRQLAMQSLIESGYISDSYTIHGAEGITELDLSNNNFKNFIGTLSGFTGLKTFLLSGNDLSTLSVSFFDTFPNVETLDISGCYLQTAFLIGAGSRIFKGLPNLKRLDLSLNLLSLLTKDIFSWNPAIESVYISGNRFREVPFDMKYTPNLKVLDLRENSITTLKNTILAEIDDLSIKSNAFSLHLSGNILSCSCENLHFLQWIFSTNVILDNERNFTCMDSAGVLTYTSAFVDLEGVWRKCRGQFFFSASLVLFCVMCIGFLTVFVVNRNKLYITSTLLKLLGGFKLKSSSDYKIGVFIGYADKDYRFPCSHLRVYIEKNLGLSTYILDRDLSLSCDTASGISYAINCSWRTVLVITERFLVEDPWAMFTLRSALYSQTADNPERVVILVEQRLHHLLPIEVVSSIPEENIVYVQCWTLDYELKEKLRTRIAGD